MGHSKHKWRRVSDTQWRRVSGEGFLVVTRTSGGVFDVHAVMGGQLLELARDLPSIRRAKRVGDENAESAPGGE